MTAPLHIRDVDGLKQRFPYMFTEPAINLEFYRGWFPYLVNLCIEIHWILENERHRFNWVQFKENSGGYEMHYNFRVSPNSGNSDLDGDREPGDVDSETDEQKPLIELKNQVDSVVQRYTVIFSKKCIVCSLPGTQTTGEQVHTFCEFHTEDARRAEGDERSLHELTALPKWPGDDVGGTTP